jgi:hypothetical protein
MKDELEFYKWLNQRKSDCLDEQKDTEIREVKINKGGKARAYKEVIQYIENHK